jgi:hypothetical protein
MIVVANKIDISTTFEGADLSMSTLTGEGVDSVLARLISLLSFPLS